MSSRQSGRTCVQRASRDTSDVFISALTLHGGFAGRREVEPRHVLPRVEGLPLADNPLGQLFHHLVDRAWPHQEPGIARTADITDLDKTVL